MSQVRSRITDVGGGIVTMYGLGMGMSMAGGALDELAAECGCGEAHWQI